jgi:hypothetical protein
MRLVEFTPGAEQSGSWVSLMAVTKCVHSDGAVPPGWKYFLLNVHVEPKAIYGCKRLGVCTFFNTMCWESISLSPTLADNRDLLEHHYAAKQHFIRTIRGTHQGDLQRCMLNKRPTLAIPRLNGYQVRTQIGKVRSHLIQSFRGNIAELHDLHRFESATQSLEFIDSHLPYNKYLFPLPEHVEGGVHGQNPKQ